MDESECGFCRRLRPLLTSAPVGGEVENSEQLREVLSRLCYLVSAHLDKTCADWTDSLDGIFPKHVRRDGPLEVQILGMCVLISDQTVVPLFLRVRLEPDADTTHRFDCMLGEYQHGRMERVPYASSKWRKQLALLDPRTIAWVFDVTKEGRSK